ncbi:putative phage abortive infection protein [Brucella ciceri]|uniref:putative phage abortive infection protein n=1 Tax=Brucella ciceri TaxID=391287 RepID=UPI0035BBB28C
MQKYLTAFRGHFDQFIGVEKGQKSPSGLFYLFITAITVSLFILLTAIAVKAFGKDLGTFGDFIGGTLNPVLTFLTFMGLLITIVLQQTELRESRVELGRSATALESQLAATDRQNFESTFFQMLTLHNTIVNSIDLYYSGRERAMGLDINKAARETKGRDCFEQFFRNFEAAYAQAAGLPDRDRLQQAYDSFWSDRQQDLAHYYRYLYNVLRFVHEAKGIKDRGPYVKLLRAQLSDYELVMLFYTALNKHGINYWLYIHEYQLFDNLPEGMLIEDSHRAFYSDRSFGEPKREPPAQWPPRILAFHFDADREKRRQRAAAGFPEVEEPTSDEILEAELKRDV